MDQFKSKTSQAVAAFEEGDLKLALKIASTFRMGVTPEQAKALKKGYECHLYASTYIQMGQDPEACIEAARKVFQELFMAKEPA